MTGKAEAELRERWDCEKDSYAAWGEYLTEKILEGLSQRNLDIKTFLKVPSQPRLKDIDRFVIKAIYLKKYDNPWDQTEDKVGTRFVVLLESDTDVVCDVIRSLENISCKQDKSPEELERSSPAAFDYVATHFVCRSDVDLVHNGIYVPAGIPCEVQVRTILQHAWSEVSHDTIYKPDFRTSVKMQRNIAKSSALVEATNDYFEKVKEEIALREAQLDGVSRWLRPIYQDVVKRKPEISQIEGQILEAVGELLDSLQMHDPETEVRELLLAKPYIGADIAEQAESMLAFRQPSILLVYFLAIKREEQLRVASPLPNDILSAVFSRVGRSF